ncbi:MAG: competence type IV pilus major pilin ComGC [Limisphaerales bacterium]
MKLRPASRRAAFTLVEIMIVVGIIGLLAALAIPNITKNRETAQLNGLLSNLRVIDNAKDLWALETNKGTGDTPTPDEIKVYLRNNEMPRPVVGETYTINPVGTPAFAVTSRKLGTNAPGVEIRAP